MRPIVTDRVAQSVGLSPSKPAKTAEAIKMPFVSRTWVDPGKHLLHAADRFEANNVLCSFNTIQPSSYNSIWCNLPAFSLRTAQMHPEDY